MTIKIPAVVATYLAADNAQDVEKLCECFTKDALVDEASHQYRGRDAIRSWKEQTVARCRYTVEPLETTVTERNIQLHARLTGNFPGSPAALHYTFVLANGQIQSLAID